MAIRCPKCKCEYDVTLFEFNNTLLCNCGSFVSLKHEESSEIVAEEERLLKIKRLADRIAFLIVSTDYPRFDLAIEKEKLKDAINELFPDKIHLYKLIYEPRFKRLEEQFRNI